MNYPGSLPLYTVREVYLIRHGATALNAESGQIDRIRGWKNVPLSAEGRKEIKELAQKLKDSGIGFIVSSDLDRARETAEEVVKTTGAKLVLTRAFRPWDLGEYTGQESAAVHPVMVNYATKTPWKRVPGGESFDGFRERVFGGLREFMMQEPNKLAAIVTHHRNERLIRAWMMKGSPADEGIDLNIMFKRGETTAHAEIVKIDMNTLYGLTDKK